MSKRERLQKKLDDIEMEQADLTVEQKKIESDLSDIKHGEHTDESYRKRNELKEKLQDIQVRKAELKKEKKKTRQDLENLTISDREELEKRVDELVHENADIREHRDHLLEEVKRLRDIRDEADELASTIQKVGVPRVARDAEDDKNIYSSTAASLWTGDIEKINDQYQRLREML